MLLLALGVVLSKPVAWALIAVAVTVVVLFACAGWLAGPGRAGALQAVENAGTALTGLIRRRAIEAAQHTGEAVPSGDPLWALKRRGDKSFDASTVRLYYDEGIRGQVQNALREARAVQVQGRGASTEEDETAANSVNTLDDLVSLRKRIIEVRNRLDPPT